MSNNFSKPNRASIEATFSVLVMSLASSATMAMGLAPDPATGQLHKDLIMAKFNIDLMLTLQSKTKGNLTEEENRFLTTLLQDLQLKYIQQNTDSY